MDWKSKGINMSENLIQKEEEGLPAVMVADKKIHADPRLPIIPQKVKG